MVWHFPSDVTFLCHNQMQNFQSTSWNCENSDCSHFGLKEGIKMISSLLEEINSSKLFFGFYLIGLVEPTRLFHYHIATRLLLLLLETLFSRVLLIKTCFILIKYFYHIKQEYLKFMDELFRYFYTKHNKIKYILIDYDNYD